MFNGGWQVINEAVEGVIAQAVDPTKADYAVITGIQIHSGANVRSDAGLGCSPWALSSVGCSAHFLHTVVTHLWWLGCSEGVSLNVTCNVAPCVRCRSTMPPSRMRARQSLWCPRQAMWSSMASGNRSRSSVDKGTTVQCITTLDAITRDGAMSGHGIILKDSFFRYLLTFSREHEDTRKGSKTHRTTMLGAPLVMHEHQHKHTLCCVW